MYMYDLNPGMEFRHVPWLQKREKSCCLHAQTPVTDCHAGWQAETGAHLAIEIQNNTSHVAWLLGSGCQYFLNKIKRLLVFCWRNVSENVNRPESSLGPIPRNGYALWEIGCRILTVFEFPASFDYSLMTKIYPFRSPIDCDTKTVDLLVVLIAVNGRAHQHVKPPSAFYTILATLGSFIRYFLG